MKTTLLLASAAFGLASLGQAQTPLTTELVASGFSSPLWAGSPKGDDRIFVVEQSTHAVRIIENGSILATPFIDVTSVGIVNGSERGLLGMAFHPDYNTNGLFYLNYTRTGGATVIAEFTSTPGADVSDGPGSPRVILEVPQPFSNHNAGHIAFSPIDGYLYIGLGDGGSGNDPGCRSQNPGQLLGKMLRIDIDNTDPGLEYAIPGDNPFLGNPAFRPEIWDLGLRNPFRYEFDQLTGDLYIGDVGQDAREEIDVVPALSGGRNYGWRVMEGELCNGLGSCPTAQTPGCFDPAFTMPVTTLAHSGGFGGGPCAITGGHVYRGSAIPDLQGTYFFVDYCENIIRSFDWDGALGADNFTDRTAELDPPGAASIGSVTSFGLDGDNEILIVDQGGEIFRIVAENPSLDTNVSRISVGAGGTQTMALDGGVGVAGQTYIVLGSLSGTQPGVASTAGPILLNPDFYTNLTIVTANTGPLVNTIGVLSASGTATASFTAGAGTLPSSIIGLDAYHAFVTLDVTGNVGFASGARRLSFDS